MKKNRILIVGAGVAGKQLLRRLKVFPKTPYLVVGFIDDDKKKTGKIIDTVPILGTIKDLAKIIRNYQIDQLFIAIPSARGEAVRGIVAACEGEKMQFRIVPRHLDTIYRGGVRLDQIKEVQIEDLLGSSIVKTEQSKFRKAFFGKRILVTGAAGSIGSELCRQLIQFEPQKLIAVDWWENGIFELELEISKVGSLRKFQGVIANIQEYKAVKNVFHGTKPDFVFHAAAFKHVPLMQRHPAEAVKNNVFGTENILRVSLQEGVKKLVYISTDKAAEPANMMGTTKLMGERLVHYYNQKGRTKYMSVRFGNVVNSHGSVVPVFRKQIAQGGPVTVTDPQMERYFMNISEAVQLVLRTCLLGKGGEIFILNMGEPVKIYDLARLMIVLSGFVPEKDISIQFIGKRPGEKISEVLVAEGELLETTESGKIFKVMKNYDKNMSLRDLIQKLRKAVKEQKDQEVIALLKRSL